MESSESYQFKRDPKKLWMSRKKPPKFNQKEESDDATTAIGERLKIDIEMSPSFIETLHQASQGVPYIAKTLIKGTISNYKQELFTHTDQTKILNYFHALVETNFGNIATVFENWINANQAAKDFLIKIAKEGTSKLHLNETGPLMPFIRMGLVDTVGRREFTIKNPLFKQWIIKKHIEPNKDKDQLEKEGIVSPGFSAAKILDRIAYEDKISTTIINDAASTDNRFGDALEEEIRKKFKNRATLRVEGGNIQTEENFYQTIRAQLELHYPELVNDPEISSAIETQNLGKIVQRIIELSQKKVVIIFTNADQVRNPEIVGSGFGGKIRSTLQRFRDKDFSIIFTTHNSMMHFSGSILNDNRGSQLYNICGYQEVKPENEANVRQYAQLKSLLVDTEKKIKNEIELYGSVRSQTITEKSRIEFKISQLLY